MKEKKQNCKYCGKELEAKTTRREFCSNKCKVYWHRENVADEKLKVALNNDKEVTEILEEINNADPIPQKKSKFQEYMEQAERELKSKK